MKTITYELQRWIPRQPSWVPGSSNFCPGHWQTAFLFKSLPKARKDRDKFNRSNFVNRGKQPWQIVKVTREKVS